MFPESRRFIRSRSLRFRWCRAHQMANASATQTRKSTPPPIAAAMSCAGVHSISVDKGCAVWAETPSETVKSTSVSGGDGGARGGGGGGGSLVGESGTQAVQQPRGCRALGVA